MERSAVNVAASLESDHAFRTGVSAPDQKNGVRKESFVPAGTDQNIPSLSPLSPIRARANRGMW